MTAIDEARRPRGPWTYDRLRAVTPEDTVRREILDGWLYVDGQRVDDPFADVARESSGPSHGDAVREMIAALLAYGAEHEGQVYTAPMDVQIGPHVLQPDVFWLPRSAPRHTRPIQVRPLLVVEVSSPSTRRHDLVRKRRAYKQAGVPEYWFVDLDGQRFECYRRQGDGYADPALVARGAQARSAVLPGLAVDVAEVLGPEDDEAE